MSTNQYAAFYGINPATAGKAFTQLLDEEIIYKKRGVGMFVRPEARARLQSQLRERFVAEVIDPMIAQAKAIDMPLSDIVDYLNSKHEENGQ